MFWKILLLVIAGLILIGGIGKTIWDAKQRKPDLNTTRNLIITIILSFLAGIYPIIDLLKPSKTDEILYEVRELRREIGQPIRYEDGIPQSENLNLKGLFKEGQKHLDNYEYEKAIKSFRAALALQGVKPSESAGLLINIGIAQHKQSKWDEAEGSYKEALDWAEKGKDEWGKAAAPGKSGPGLQGQRRIG
jgi:tetratricopeptide (TPR) repeat protein